MIAKTDYKVKDCQNTSIFKFIKKQKKEKKKEIFSVFKWNKKCANLKLQCKCIHVSQAK